METVAGFRMCATHREALRLSLGAAPSSLVYYVTWDDEATVKIGTTTDPAARFATHEKTRGPIRVLAAHPGARQEERTQHRRFRRLRVDGELEVFRNAPELQEHMANVRHTWPTWKVMLEAASDVSRPRRRRTTA